MSFLIILIWTFQSTLTLIVPLSWLHSQKGKEAFQRHDVYCLISFKDNINPKRNKAFCYRERFLFHVNHFAFNPLIIWAIIVPHFPHEETEAPGI